MAIHSRPPAPDTRPPAGRDLTRSVDDRVIAGVCGGVGRRLGVDPLVVRLAAVVLTVANGIGLVAYLGAWLLLPDDADDGRPPRPLHRRGAERAVALGMITLGVLLLLRRLGLLLPDRYVFPAALAAVGAGLVWARGSDADRERWRELARGLPAGPVDALREGRGVVLRACAGAALLVIGLASLLGSSSALETLGRVGVAVTATAVGVGLILGPWILRLWRDLLTERRERIRSEERAEVAAHLHDSVLQTLALIQRHADTPARTRTLARAQERELRAWIYGGDRAGDGEGPGAGLSAALDALATDVEHRHAVAVDVVVVGDDIAVDERLDALLAAVREACVNAARHAGVAEVSVYVEVEPTHVSAFVRDRGRGFDVAAVGPGRLGVAESIIGRMTRHGGTAEVQSAPGEGTEVVLEMPR